VVSDVRIRVVTYNIHRAIGLDRRFRLDRIVNILGDHDGDIVLLQEVDEGVPRSGRMNLAKALATELDYPYYAMGHNVSLRKGRYGNATLSRYPISRERNIDLSVDVRKRRGCQHTTIELGGDSPSGYSLEVFNLHLGLSARERQRQAGILVRSSEFGTLDPGMPCLLGGDFNDWRSLLRAFFVEGMGFHCATDRGTERGPRAIRTYPSFSPQGALDRIYYRGGLRLLSVNRCRHQIARIASDHLPVFATFELQRKAGQS
jgi:endonuclease/exonuclease/phosphatase family metal-dependent hydrolase